MCKHLIMEIVKLVSSLLTTRNIPPNLGITATVQVDKSAQGTHWSYSSLNQILTYLPLEPY